MELLLIIAVIVLMFGYIVMLGVIIDYYSYKRRKYKEMIDDIKTKKEIIKGFIDNEKETTDRDRR